MKKILCSLFVFIALTGCALNVEDVDNTPTKQVEAYLNSYQSLDENVLNDLDLVIEQEESFTDEDKTRYRDIMTNNFENLTYTIKDEVVNGDTATVEAEIQVTDFYKVNTSAEDYLEENEADFNDEEGLYDESKFITYKLDEMEKATDKVKYTIYFTLQKDDDGNWVLDDINDTDEEKILGMYAY